MQVHVLALPEARNELLHLLAALSPGMREDDAARMADVYLTDIEQILLQSHGKPYPVYRVRGGDGKDYWWRYCKGVWVVYTIQDRRGGLFGSAARRVTITRFAADGPHP